MLAIITSPATASDGEASSGCALSKTARVCALGSRREVHSVCFFRADFPATRS